MSLNFHSNTEEGAGFTLQIRWVKTGKERPLVLCPAHLICPTTYRTQMVTIHVLRSRTRWVDEVWVRLGRLLSPGNPRGRAQAMPGATRKDPASRSLSSRGLHAASGLGELGTPGPFLAQPSPPRFAGRKKWRWYERSRGNRSTPATGGRNLSPLSAAVPREAELFFSHRCCRAEGCGQRNGPPAAGSSRRGRRLLTWAGLVGQEWVRVAMAVDITLLFRASVKTVKTRNKALGVAVGGGVEGSRDELFRRSPRPKGDFSSRAREVVSWLLWKRRAGGGGARTPNRTVCDRQSSVSKKSLGKVV